MKISILGAGALGSTIGGTLAEAGHEVYLISLNKEHVKNINTNGLILREGNVDRKVLVEARTNSEGIGPVDLIIVLVKAFDTKTAIESASSMLGEKTIVMSLQNGLGNEEILAEVIGSERLIGGKTYVGGVMLGPGHVLIGVKNKRTYIGELDGTQSERVTHIAEVFNKAGLLTEVTSNIIGMIWDKLLINAATGALAGITRLPYGGLYQIPEIRECAYEAIKEGIAVANANKVVLSTEDPQEIWLKAAEGLPNEFKTSILQSLEQGLKTEIDYINGSIIKYGEKFDIRTPVNKTLVANVKGIEFMLQNYK